MDDLSGLMRGLDGDAAGADPAAAVSGLANAIGAEGGLDGLVDKLRDAGLGDQVDSWIGGGPNQPIDPQQLGAALGDDEVQRLAGSSGLDIAALLPMLAAFLPQIINMLTPQGSVPDGGLDGAIGSGGMPDLGGLLGGLMGAGGAAGAGEAGGSAGGLDDLLGGLGGLMGGGGDR
jgi:uncharacterized protein YidB (DUF937 family)